MLFLVWLTVSQIMQLLTIQFLQFICGRHVLLFDYISNSIGFFRILLLISKGLDHILSMLCSIG